MTMLYFVLVWELFHVGCGQYAGKLHNTDYGFMDIPFKPEMTNGDYYYSPDSGYVNSPHYDDYYENNAPNGAKSGYSEPAAPPMEPKKQYVPVVVKKKEKKQKILSVTKGSYIPGGTQIFGKFKDLKSCMKACASTPTCFAGDFNPWEGKCYFHSNFTACANMQSHKKITHFKKVPCSVTDAPNGLVTLGANLPGGIEQKGIKSLSDCLKKCASAGGGIASAAALLSPTALFDHNQICFGIDYDFASHKCYFHTVLYRRPAAATNQLFALCPFTTAVIGTPTRVLTPIDLQPSPSTVNVILCPTI